MSDLKAILTINIACLEETVLHTEQKLNVSEMVILLFIKKTNLLHYFAGFSFRIKNA